MVQEFRFRFAAGVVQGQVATVLDGQAELSPDGPKSRSWLRAQSGSALDIPRPTLHMSLWLTSEALAGLKRRGPYEALTSCRCGLFLSASRQSARRKRAFPKGLYHPGLFVQFGRKSSVRLKAL
ncbi:hypothetical protein NHN26_15945 [Rhodovulum tesquicola]|uniref:hypothetical protein n=1 Tax=Rhodovulum tesquicola TaxID=540254 RepID=UPI002097AAC2|nr:hypothetical protein [Rhodovulum tesquicola]MCO8146704.1 hypothetical protein [Rhodovulum tesquicola]